MKRIELTKGLFAIIDNCDHAEVSKHIWHASDNGRGNIYAASLINGSKIKMHNFILKSDLKKYEVDKYEVDHINGNGLDNRRMNLRIVSHSINMSNTICRSSSGLKGIQHWHKKKWRAYIYDFEKQRQIHIGYFKSKKDAHCARLAELKHRNISSPSNKGNKIGFQKIKNTKRSWRKLRGKYASDYIGVYRNRQRWVASVYSPTLKRAKVLGYFGTQIAAKKYRDAIRGAR